jgi:hypothetical protein
LDHCTLQRYVSKPGISPRNPGQIDFWLSLRMETAKRTVSDVKLPLPVPFFTGEWQFIGPGTIKRVVALRLESLPTFDPGFHSAWRQ